MNFVNRSFHCIEFVCSPAATSLLHLDDDAMYNGEFIVQSLSKSKCKVYASLRAAISMRDNCEDRSTPNGGYDQPVSWYRVARQTRVAIINAIREASLA